LEAGLYIVPTPIGNLSDISLRAIEVLKHADLIAAEDTRHSQNLLSHLGVTTPTIAYHEHSKETVAEKLLEHLAQGQRIALISDAGTPLVSDPGYHLVRDVQAAGLPVIPLPGACSVITALSASGLPTDRFYFEGFLPAKQSQRRRRLEALANQEGTLIFLEAPHRIVATLEDMVAVLDVGREAVLARELTKTFETISRQPLEDLSQWVADDPDQQRGELVLMLGPVLTPPAQVLDASVRRILTLLAAELPPRKAAALTAEITGVKARELYEALVAQKQDEQGYT